MQTYACKENGRVFKLPYVRQFDDAELAKLAAFVAGEQLRREVVNRKETE